MPRCARRMELWDQKHFWIDFLNILGPYCKSMIFTVVWHSRIFESSVCWSQESSKLRLLSLDSVENTRNILKLWIPSSKIEANNLRGGVDMTTSLLQRRQLKHAVAVKCLLPFLKNVQWSKCKKEETFMKVFRASPCKSKCLACSLPPSGAIALD